jgi:hypothetical protein
MHVWEVGLNQSKKIKRSGNIAFTSYSKTDELSPHAPHNSSQFIKI